MNSNEPLTLVCLHYLGGSAREFAGVADALQGVCRVVAIDLPGFGEAAAITGYSVAAMAGSVRQRIAAARASRFALLGHSMGAKISCVLSRQAQDGAAELAGLRGLVLLAGSPPSPEPMSDDKRASMLEWFCGDAAASHAQAETYLRDNVGTALPPAGRHIVIDDVLRANKDAWRAWLTAGSREDWAARIGMLGYPTLLLAGAEDAGLGAAAQQRYMLPHFNHARLEELVGAGHLLPLERPAEVANLIKPFVARL